MTSFVPSGKRGFDLDFVNHFRDALHDLIGFEQGGAVMHQFGDRLPVAGAFQKRCGQISDRLRMV